MVTTYLSSILTRRSLQILIVICFVSHFISISGCKRLKAKKFRSHIKPQIHQQTTQHHISSTTIDNLPKSSLLHEDKGGNFTKTSRHIVLVTLEAPPFMMKKIINIFNETSNTNSTDIKWYGYCMEFFEELRRHLPYELTYDIYQVPDNKYGTKYRVDNSTTSGSRQSKEPTVVIDKWNGIIGELMDGKADLALAPMAVMAERELVIDFTIPFYDLVGIQILLKRPEVPQDWFKFLTVLDNEVWFSITIAYFVTSIIMFLFDRLSPYSHKNMTRIERIKRARKQENEKLSEKSKDSISSISNLFKANGRMLHENSNDILSRGHDLFVGSLGHSMRSNNRKPSIIIEDGFLNNKRAELIEDTKKFNGKQSVTPFDDYFRSLDLRGSLTEANQEGDETEDSEDFNDGKPDFGLRDSLWFCITSLTPQGGGEAPQNLSGRVVAGAWWLFCFIIIASYTANLAAFLTVSRLDIPIESLDDLSKQYRIKYAPIDGTAEQNYFERMAYIEEIFYNIWKDMSLNDSMSEEERAKFAVWDYPISDKYTKIWAQIQQVGMPPNVHVGVSRVKNSNLDDGFALLADANIVKHAVMTDCSLKAVGDEFSRKPIALAIRKGDDKFRDDLSYAILQLINQRFMEILREKWWTNNPDRVICENNDESEGISIENIGGVFIIIFAGVALSFIVWGLERYVYKAKMKLSKDLIQKL